MRKALKILAAIIAAILVLAGGYAAYLFIDYHRIEDNQLQNVRHAAAADQDETVAAPLDQDLSILTYNIGFGAYLQDYSSFLDGGRYSRAYSKESVEQDMKDIDKVLTDADADFYLIQEVDEDSTRAHHVNEVELIRDEPAFAEYDSTFAINFDSPYMFYPLTSPHGKAKSGMLTMSRYRIDSSLRRSLPVQTDLMKFFDLDRCYTINRIPTADGRQLCLYAFHLSAYTTDKTIVTRQLEQMVTDMKADIDAGSYVIAGGDANMDLLGNSGEIFGVVRDDTWAKPFPKSSLPEGISLVAAFDEEHPTATTRDCDIPYTPGKSFLVTVDGFLVSDNVKVISAEVRDLEFRYSDHNPVEMKFRLVPEK